MQVEHVVLVVEHGRILQCATDFLAYGIKVPRVEKEPVHVDAENFLGVVAFHDARPHLCLEHWFVFKPKLCYAAVAYCVDDLLFVPFRVVRLLFVSLTFIDDRILEYTVLFIPWHLL